jgi:hypothetical protein
MNIELSEEALAYGRLARQAIEAAGGDGLVQDAEREPSRREQIFAPVLGELGAWELDPRGDADDLEAAAALCRAAGYWGVAYPVGERLARPADHDADGLLVVAETGPAAAPVACLDLRWAAVTPSGRRSRVTGMLPGGPPRTAAFVTQLELAPLELAPLDLAPVDDDGTADVALGLVLPCWTLLGMLDRAIDLARSHVLMREQFGQPLSGFQSVQFQLTDAEVERSGTEVLAKYSRCEWRPWRRPRWCSGSRTSCTARSGSATSCRCRGCPGTASRCGGCRSACPRHAPPSPGGSAPTG